MFERVLASRIVVAIGSTALIAALSAGVAPAQADTSPASVRHVQVQTVHYVRVQTTESADGSAAASPDFTCPSSTFCLFQDTNLAGHHYSFTTDVWNGFWFSVTQNPFNFTLPWGSFHNNSDSTAYFYDAQINTLYCVLPNTEGTPIGPVASEVHARYLYIKYGVSTCQFPDPPS